MFKLRWFYKRAVKEEHDECLGTGQVKVLEVTADTGDSDRNKRTTMISLFHVIEFLFVYVQDLF